MKKSAKVLATLSTVVIVTTILIELTLPHLGFLWHLTHENRFSVGASSFVVPPQYRVVSGSGQELTLARLSAVVPFFPMGSPVSGVFAKENLIIIDNSEHKKFYEEVDSQRLKDWLTTQERQAGLELQATRNLKTPIGSAHCFHFGNNQRSQVRCFVDQSALTVFFDGEPRYANDAYVVLETAAKARGPQ